MTIDLAAHALGLETDAQRHVHRLLNDYDRNLSLRRIPQGDPAFRPDKPFGVWEEGITGAATNWVFTLSEAMIDERVLSRIAQADMAKHGVPEKIAKMQAATLAAEASKMRRRMEDDQEKKEEMLGVVKLAAKNGTIRHRINGERVLIGDEIRRPQTFITR